MKKKSAALLVSTLGACAAAASLLWRENNTLETERLCVDCHLGREIRIVHLSDLHGKQFGGNNQPLAQRVLACEPDLIVFTGDLISADMRNLEPCASFLGGLCLRAPVVYIPGNHEHRSGHTEEICASLRRAGVTVLRDELVTLQMRGIPVHILGLDEEKGASFQDYLAKPVEKDRSRLLTHLEQCEGLRVILSHNPENFACTGENSYRNYRFDLMFAGHAHGGQVRLPAVGGVLSPGQGFFPRYTDGVYGKGPRLVVSRGLGNSLIPIRIANRPSILSLSVL